MSDDAAVKRYFAKKEKAIARTIAFLHGAKIEGRMNPACTQAIVVLSHGKRRIAYRHQAGDALLPRATDIARLVLKAFGMNSHDAAQVAKYVADLLQDSLTRMVDAVAKMEEKTKKARRERVAELELLHAEKHLRKAAASGASMRSIKKAVRILQAEQDVQEVHSK